ncbi:hypothetical protein ACFLYA_00960 [Candidatus Dependentiae bacterium]
MIKKAKIFLFAGLFCIQPHICFSAGEWELPATNLSDPGQSAFSPQVAMDPAGNAIAVWVRSDDLTALPRIQSKRYNAETDSWVIPTTGIYLSDSEADVPQVAMDPAGNAIAVWIWGAVFPPPFRIQAKKYDAQTDSWVVPTPGIDISGDFAFAPQVAMDPTGNAIAVWQRIDGGTTKFVIQAKRYKKNTDSWVIPAPGIDLSDPTEEAFSPQVAMDSAGNAIAVWSIYDGIITDRVQAKRYNAETDSWMITATNLSDPGENTENPQVAMDPSGNAIAIWHNKSNDRIQAKRYDAETDSWVIPITGINLSDPGQNAALPQVAMDSTGNAVAVWQISDGSNVRIQAKRYDAETDSWVNPATGIYLSDPGQDAGLPQVAMDSAGNAIAVWQRSDGSNTIIQAKRYDARTDSWSTTATNLSAPGKNASQPQVAMNPAGNAVAVWKRSDGSDFRIQAALFFPIPAPSNLIARQKVRRFPAQVDLTHVLCWDAVEGVVKYRIYADSNLGDIITNVSDNEKISSMLSGDIGILIAEIPAQTKPCFVVHARCPGVKMTYYVVGVDEGGNNGIPASVTI